MPFRALLDILFPPLCHLCKAYIPERRDLHLCSPCLARVVAVGESFCTVCGVPFATALGHRHRCGACLVHPPPYDLCRSATLYQGAIQDLIHRLKYGHKVHLALPLGLLLAERLAPFAGEAAPEVVVPVPLHRRRLSQRGFNQSQLIGEELGKRWRVPLQWGNLVRARWTEPQTTLPAARRRTNVQGAFEVRHPERLRGKRVLLVDDVLTTGSTARACAEALRRAGVAAVLVATVARGVPA